MSQGVRASLRGHHEKMQPLFAILSRQNTRGGGGGVRGYMMGFTCFKSVHFSMTLNTSC